MAFFGSQRKSDSEGNCLGPIISWVSFFQSDDMDTSSFSRVAKVDLFLGTGLGLDPLVELDREALHTDSFIPQATSINLEEERGRFSKKIKYSSNIP